ncbi:hypothetical protein PFLuk1_02875 [Pseudomonas fluorescens]|nr:hypothetical protein PFLuk1_02875 [Pseudomonas fluorescens]
MPGHALDGRHGEQVGGITQGGTQGRRAFFHIQRQVELGHAFVQIQDFDVQVGQAMQMAVGSAHTVVEQHLE